MKKRQARIRLLIAVGALGALFWVVPLHSVVEALRQTQPGWLLVGLGLQILMRILTAVRMTLLARYQGLALSFPQMLTILYTASFYSLLLPGALMGGAATYVKYRQHGGEAGRSLGNVVVNKGLEIFAMLGLATLAGCYLQGGVKLLMVAMLVCLLVGWSYRQAALGWGLWPKFRRWVKRSPSKLAKAVGTHVEHLNVFERVTPLQSRLLLAIAFGCQFVGAGAFIVMGRAVGADVSWVYIIWVYTMVYLLALLPVTLANAGVREGIMIWMLQPMGVNAAVATAWSLCLYMGPLMSAVFGALLESHSGSARKG